MKTRLNVVILVIMSAVFAGASWGDSITINNPSFESTSCSGPGPVSCAADGWTGQGATFLPATGDMQAFDGSQYGFVNAGGSLTQDLSTLLLPDTEYELTVWVANRTNNSDAGFCPLCTFDPVVELVAGGSTVLGQASGNTPAIGTWAEWTLDYTSPASGDPVGQDLSIVLSASASQGDFDLLQLQSVPEPSTMLLVGAGLLAVLGGARRRRRTAK